MQKAFQTVIEFEINGRPKTLAYPKLPMAAWRELKHEAGFTPLSFMQALNEWDVDAIVALVWLERKQRERKLAYRDAVTETEQSFDETGIDFKVTNLHFGEQEDDGDPPTTGS